jgi:hypothetical protein
MWPVPKRFTWFFLFCLPFSAAFAEPDKGVADGGRPADFNIDGKIDEKDLLDLAPRMGAKLGENNEYGLQYDLDGDFEIDPKDFTLFGEQWKSLAATGEAMPVDEIRRTMGLDTLSGQTWRYRCIGGESDCGEEERTITGGAIRNVGDRIVLPIIWGSGSGEPWAEVLMTLDGPLEILGIEKIGGPEGLPGFRVAANMGVESSGPIALTTSEVMYAGSPILSSGTTAASISVDLGPFELKGTAQTLVAACIVVLIGISCSPCDIDCDYCYDWNGACDYQGSYHLGCPPPSNCNACREEIKGEEALRPVIFMGEGVLDYETGQATGTWEIFSSNGQILLFHLTWTHGGLTKSLTFAAFGSSSCQTTVPEQEVEIEHCGLFHNDITEGVCLSGVVGSGIDIQDMIRLNQQGTAGRVAVTIRHSVPQGSEGLAQLWRFPPGCTAGDLLDFANFTGNGEALVESPFITTGPNVYVIVSPEGDQGADGGPIAYEVQFENN